jgi:hypothetical protein
VCVADAVNRGQKLILLKKSEDNALKSTDYGPHNKPNWEMVSNAEKWGSNKAKKCIYFKLVKVEDSSINGVRQQHSELAKASSDAVPSHSITNN